MDMNKEYQPEQVRAEGLFAYHNAVARVPASPGNLQGVCYVTSHIPVSPTEHRPESPMSRDTRRTGRQWISGLSLLLAFVVVRAFTVVLALVMVVAAPIAVRHSLEPSATDTAAAALCVETGGVAQYGRLGSRFERCAHRDGSTTLAEFYLRDLRAGSAATADGPNQGVPPLPLPW